MARTIDAEGRARAILAVPDDERGEEWIKSAWSTAGTLRSRGQARRAQDLEDAAERAEQAEDDAAAEAGRDRWPGSRWTHRGERMTAQVVAGPQIRDGRTCVRIRDGRQLRWEPIAFLIERFERT